MRKLLSLFLVLSTFSIASFSQTTDMEKMRMEREAQLRAETATQNPDLKVNAYAEPMQIAKAVNTAGALTARGKSNVTALVASPNAEDFNTHLLPTMQAFEGVDYTVTADLGALTIAEMLQYDVLLTFNVTKWDVGTNTTAIDWSNMLGDYITAGGYLVEAQFVNGYDDWGLGSGTYITENMSPFNMSTKDQPTEDFVLGEVLIPDHPIMSGVTTFTTNYFVQDVTVREDATLIARWGNATTDPLVAVYDNIVALNADPIFSDGNAQSPGLGGDGYKLLHNAIVWLYNNQADPAAPAAPTNLEVTPGAMGALEASVEWVNPTETFGGDPLTELTSVILMVNDAETPEDVINNPVTGATETYTYTATEAGTHVFTVYGTNAAGDGVATSKTVWIGEDAPGAPQNVVLTAIADGGKVTWDAPTEGIGGGYINPANTTYTVIRMPDNTVAEGIVETEYTDIFNPSIGNYQYKVIASNSIGEGGTALSNSVLLGAEGIVFYEAFDGLAQGSMPAGWSKEGFTDASWTVQNTSNAGGVAPEMRLYWNPSFVDLTRLVTNSFSVQDNDKLRLKLKHYLNNFAASGNTLAIQVSFDDGEWTNLWDEELTSNIGPMDMEFYIDIPTGTAEMRLGWEFNGDSYDINGYYFDDVVVEPVKGDDLAAISVAGNPTPTAGEVSTYTVTVQNAGTASQSDYTVKLMREGGIELASAPGVPINFAETKEFEFDWTPAAEDEGAVVIYGEVELAGDEQPLNNQTENYLLNVQPEGIFTATIGTGTTLPSIRIPFDFFWKNSFSQTLYFPEEIGLGGGILTSIAYTNSFDSDLTAKNIKVWVGETDVDDLTGGWVDPATLTLVYDGTMDFPSGENTILIPLDELYVYGGGNLVVYTNRVWEDSYESSSDKFFGTEDVGSNRTYRISKDGTAPLDPLAPGEGTISDWHPNTTLYFSTAGLGSLNGTVTDSETTDPLEGVLVSIVGTNTTATTDPAGLYEFPALLPGTYSVEYELFGYTTHTETDVTILEDEAATNDVALDPIPSYTVTGVINGNDGNPLEGAEVTLTGYGDYNATTGTDGTFSIEGVYGGIYSIAVYMQGYEPHAAEGIEIDANLDLDPIVLSEIIIIPSGLSVDVFNQDQGEALFTWSDGEVEFRYDDGTADGQLGFQNGTVDNVLGAVHRHNAKLNSVSWYLTSEGGPHATVKVWILGLTEAGIPDASNVLFSQDGIENTDMEWNTFELPETVQAPNGFFIGVGSAGFSGLATDTGTDTEWPFQPNSNYGGNTASGDFFTFESQDFMVNALIRATGTDLGELRFDPEAVHYPMVSDLVYTKNETPVSTYNPSSTPSTKAFSGYDIYLDDMDTPVATAIQENEYLFTDLTEGTHTAGVQAVHTTGSSEIITIDFEVDFGVNVKVNVTANSGDSPEGAQVTLVGENHEYTGEANAQGLVEFPVVYTGIYNLTVSLINHDVYEQENIDIQEDEVFDVELQEIIVMPFSLMVELDPDKPTEALLSWNGADQYFADSFEDETFDAWDEFIQGPGTPGDGGNSYWHVTDNADGGSVPDGSFVAKVDWGYDIDTWLISPLVMINSGAGITFNWYSSYHWSVDPNPNAQLTVEVSTDNGVTWTPIWNWQDIGVWDNFTWYESTVPLDAYVGQAVHIAMHLTGSDNAVSQIDNVRVGTPTKFGNFAISSVPNVPENAKSAMNVKTVVNKAFNGFNILLDGNPVEEAFDGTSYLFTGLEPETTYTAGVQSAYTSGNSETVEITFTTVYVSTPVNQLSKVNVYPNPFSEMISISNPELVERVVITNILGQQIMDMTLNGQKEITTSELGSGIYLITFEGFNGERTVRKMIKK